MIILISHDEIYTDEDGYGYIKLKNSWAWFSIIEVYLKKVTWKENGNDMFCLLERNSQYTKDSDLDTFVQVDEESNNNCYYID